MLVPVLVTALLTAAPVPECAAGDTPVARHPIAGARPASDSSLVTLYASGIDYATFLANAKSRREQWLGNSEAAAIPVDVLSAARAIPGRWRLLVIAVDGCSDSVNTIPYIAKLVEGTENLEMRIVLPDPGRAVMEGHRTADGRAATPTVVLLDPDGKDVGCWVERPSSLQAKLAAPRADGAGFAKQEWYDADAGASTVREVVAMIAAAAAGTPSCGPAR